MREVIGCFFASLHGLHGEDCWLESLRLQQAKQATSAKHVINWNWTVSKCSNTKYIFPNSRFLDSGRKK